jgi:hypothetical protein
MISETLQIPMKYCILVLLLPEAVKYSTEKVRMEVGIGKLLKLFPPYYTMPFRMDQNLKGLDPNSPLM